MTDTPCAPPVGLRDKPGRHWLTREGWGDVVAVWEPDVPCWTWGGSDRDPEWALRSGWRYLAPVTTPAEVALLRAQVVGLKSTVVAFCGPWAAQYARGAGLPDGHLMPAHYDILEQCGARMDDFTRVPEPTP